MKMFLDTIRIIMNILLYEIWLNAINLCQPDSAPGPLITKKTPSYQNRDSHYKAETVVRPS